MFAASNFEKKNEKYPFTTHRLNLNNTKKVAGNKPAL
jgi:hypothetical protein